MANVEVNADERLEDAPVSNKRLNSLRAAVLGANDGIVSVSSIILGVAGATSNRTAIFTAGIAGLAAGALSMAVGEFVSVSSQRDTERVYIAQEKFHLAHHAEEEFNDLISTYQTKGLSATTARQVARELTDHDAVKAHLDAEFGINERDLNSPSLAAIASLVAFAIGGSIPLVATIAAAQQVRLATTFVAVLVALTITGFLSAIFGRASWRHAIVRVVIGGFVAMLITYSVGYIFGRIIG